MNSAQLKIIQPSNNKQIINQCLIKIAYGFIQPAIAVQNPILIITLVLTLKLLNM